MCNLRDFKGTFRGVTLSFKMGNSVKKPVKAKIFRMYKPVKAKIFRVYRLSPTSLIGRRKKKNKCITYLKSQASFVM